LTALRGPANGPGALAGSHRACVKAVEVVRGEATHLNRVGELDVQPNGTPVNIRMVCGEIPDLCQVLGIPLLQLTQRPGRRPSAAVGLRGFGLLLSDLCSSRGGLRVRIRAAREPSESAGEGPCRSGLDRQKPRISQDGRWLQSLMTEPSVQAFPDGQPRRFPRQSRRTTLLRGANIANTSSHQHFCGPLGPRTPHQKLKRHPTVSH
jgi:hypothetical protein